tara:strand:+ start:36 stop:590 length:555 start_codon:yes stop_codon:yes gene_type:complete
MQKNISGHFQFDLDLSFVPFSVNDLDIFIDTKTKDFLQNACLWEVEMFNWITCIKANKNLFCYPIVRDASKLSLGLELTNDKKIYELNNAWLGKSRTTDVLSFPIVDHSFFAPSNEIIELGDIVISVPTAMRQAKEHNVDLFREISWLATHGLLHLLGWDHLDEASLAEMLSTQEQLLDLSGIL